MMHQDIKKLLLQQSSQWILARHERILKSISDINLSLQDESKSTSGDKHHTGRAMLHIERENAGNQLREVENVLQQVSKIDIKNTSQLICLGSLVACTKASYFIGISVGAIDVNGSDYFCVAPNSPIGKLLLGKKTGESFSFNGMVQKIINVN